jgi:hypothetical protein
LATSSPAPPVPDAAGLRDLLGQAERLTRSGQHEEALELLRPQLAWPGLAHEVAWSDVCDVLADVCRKHGWRNLARALVNARGLVKPPLFGKAAWRQSTATTLEQIASGWLDARQPLYAAAFLGRARKLAPERERIAASLAGALDAAERHKDAATLLADQPRQAVGDTPPARIALARNALLAADLPLARRALEGVTVPAGAALLNMLIETREMLERAERLHDRANNLGEDDARGWHFVRTGVLLVQIAVGEDSRRGYHETCTDSPERIRAGIDACAIFARERAITLASVRAMPGREGRLLAAIAARRLGLTVLADDAPPGPGELWCCYELGKIFGDEDRLAARPPGSVAWLHAFTPAADGTPVDVVTLACRRLNSPFLADPRPGDELARVIAEGEPAPLDLADLAAVSRAT